MTTSASVVVGRTGLPTASDGEQPLLAAKRNGAIDPLPPVANVNFEARQKAKPRREAGALRANRARCSVRLALPHEADAGEA